MQKYIITITGLILALLCNDTFHWLGASLETALQLCHLSIKESYFTGRSIVNSKRIHAKNIETINALNYWPFALGIPWLPEVHCLLNGSFRMVKMCPIMASWISISIFCITGRNSIKFIIHSIHNWLLSQITQQRFKIIIYYKQATIRDDEALAYWSLYINSRTNVM